MSFGHRVTLHQPNGRRCSSECNFLLLLLYHPSGLARRIDAISLFAEDAVVEPLRLSRERARKVVFSTLLLLGCIRPVNGVTLSYHAW